MDNDKSRSDQGETNTEASRWKSAEIREVKVKQIMDSLLIATPQSWISNSSDIKKIAEKIEEHSYSSATDENDYLAKISTKSSQITKSPQSAGFNRLHANSSSSSEPSSSPARGRAADTEFQEKVYQRIGRMKDTYMKRLTTVYQFLAHKARQELNPTDMKKFKYLMKIMDGVFMHLRVTKSEITADFMERLDRVENTISYILRGPSSHSADGMQQHVPSNSRNSELELSGQKPTLQGNLQSSLETEQITTKKRLLSEENSDTSQHSSKSISPSSSFESADQEQNSGASETGSSASMQRLLKALTNISPEALSASVSEIGAVVRLTDRMSASEPLNGSRNAVGRDLEEDIYARFQSKQNICAGSPAMYTASAKNPVERCCSGTKRPVMNYDLSQEQLIRLKEEIREINKLLVDTVVVIIGEERMPYGVELVEGLIVKFHFSAVTVDMNVKSLQASDQVSIIKPLQLLVPTGYPQCSPIFLDEFPSEVCTDLVDFSTRAKWKLGQFLRTLMQPFSIKDIAVSWENCAREAIIDYAQKNGGGTFSSKYGEWEEVLQ